MEEAQRDRARTSNRFCRRPTGWSHWE